MAGLYEACFEEVVWNRMLQGYPAFSIHSLNAGTLDLLAIARFFEAGRLHPDALLPRIDRPLVRGRLYWWVGLVLRLHGRTAAATAMFEHARADFRMAGDPVGEAAALGYASRCLLSAGQVAHALVTARQASDVVERDLALFGKRFLEAANMGPILRTGMQLVCRVQAHKVPLFQRIVNFPLADVLHHAGHLDEALEIFSHGYQARLPLIVKTWDLFVAQDAMYFDLLLTLGWYDEAEEMAVRRLEKVRNSQLLAALMNITLRRIEIHRLSDPRRIPDVMLELRDHGEQLDYRTSYHAARAILELAAAARRLGQSALAATLLGRARALADEVHWHLGEVDLLIEEARLAIDAGQAQTGMVRVMRARKLVEKQGYRLREAELRQVIANLQGVTE